MLESVRRFFSDLARGGQANTFAENDYRVAAAALLVHVLTLDGAISEPERERLHALVRYRFDLSDEAADELIAEARTVEGEAVDLYRFTSLLNRELDDVGRARIIEMMWEMIYVDGRVNEFEDNLVWRVADLLNVPSGERIALRRQIAGEATGEGQ